MGCFLNLLWLLLGGIAVAIMEELKLPVLYIGVGEGIEDLQAFDADAFVEAIF